MIFGELRGIVTFTGKRNRIISMRTSIVFFSEVSDLSKACYVAAGTLIFFKNCGCENRRLICMRASTEEMAKVLGYF